MSSVLQFTRGAAASGVIGALVLALGVLAGMLPGPSILVFPLAASAGVAFVLIPDRRPSLQVTGALFVGLGALGMGIVSGFEGLQICGMIGAFLAALVVGGVLSLPRTVSVRVLALLALGLVLANLIPLIVDGGGLGHDESAYAVKAQHWLEGTPETGWSPHRGIAMSGYGYLVLSAGGGEAGLRLLGLGSLLGLAVAAWILGSRVGGPKVGPLAAIAVVSSPALLFRSSEYLSDVPASALLVACMFVVWVEFGERDRPTYRLLWLLPFAWAAFYLRYQSVLSFALIAVAVGVVFSDKARAGWRPILATGVVGLAGLVPHFIFASSEMDSPLGILFFTAEVAGREFLGEGLRDYFLLMGWRLAAFIGPIAAGFFIWWLLKSWSISAERTRSLFLMIPAVGQVLILGVLSHGEARFIFFPLTLTLIGGTIGLLYVSRTWGGTVAAAVRLGLALLLLGSLAASTNYLRREVDSRFARTEPIELAGEEMQELSEGAGCSVMTSYLPQITFYSTCYTAPFRTQLEPEEALEFLPGDQRFLLLVEDGKRQPTGTDLEGLLALTDQTPIIVSGERESADIYVFSDE